MKPGQAGFVEGVGLLAVLAALAAPVLSALALYRGGHAWLLGDGLVRARTTGLAALATYLLLAALMWYIGWLERTRRRAHEASGKGKGIRASRRTARRRQEFRRKYPNYLSSPSRVAGRWAWVHGVVWLHVAVGALGVVAAILALDMIQGLDSFTAAVTGERFTDRVGLYLVGLMTLNTLAWLAVARLVWWKLAALATRHRRVAEQVEGLAHALGWTYDIEESTVDGDWKAAPFDRVIGLTAVPRAHPVTGGRRRGVAWLEGDFGPDVFPYRAFMSRVAWVELPRDLKPVDLVPERMSDAVVKLLGGRDVDVESYDFNRRWRVKADDEREAHGILQPRMIDFLNSVDDPSVAFHIDGERVLIWDDGRDEDVDLVARTGLLDAFVDRLPGHLRVEDPRGR